MCRRRNRTYPPGGQWPAPRWPHGFSWQLRNEAPHGRGGGCRDGSAFPDGLAHVLQVPRTPDVPKSFPRIRSRAPPNPGRYYVSILVFSIIVVMGATNRVNAAYISHSRKMNVSQSHFMFINLAIILNICFFECVNFIFGRSKCVFGTPGTFLTGHRILTVLRGLLPEVNLTFGRCHRMRLIR